MGLGRGLQGKQSRVVVLAGAGMPPAAAAGTIQGSLGIERVIEGRHGGVLPRCGPGLHRDIAQQLATGMPETRCRPGIDSEVFQAFEPSSSGKCAFRLCILLVVWSAEPRSWQSNLLMPR